MAQWLAVVRVVQRFIRRSSTQQPIQCPHLRLAQATHSRPHRSEKKLCPVTTETLVSR
jgi:hypothetical protein